MDTFSSDKKTARRVMVAENSLTIRKIVSSAISDLGFYAHECSTGKAALLDLETDYYDVLYLGFSLPDMDARELLSKLVKDTRYTHLSVVLMSSKQAEINRLYNFDNVVSGVLIKPFTPKQVVASFNVIVATKERDGSQRLQSILQEEIKSGERTHFKKPDVVLSNSLYNLMDQHFERFAKHLPALEKKRGNADPVKFYPAYLNHPQLKKAMRATINKHYKKTIEESTLPSRSGSLDAPSLFQLISFFYEQKPSGKLSISSDELPVDIYFHKGLVLAITTVDTDQYLRQAGLQPSEFDAELREQDDNGMPPIIRLKGDPVEEDLQSLLLCAAKNLLTRALAHPCQYSFWEQSRLPDWASNHSLGLLFSDLSLDALRAVKGWDELKIEFGDLSAPFIASYSQIPSWLVAGLTELEATLLENYKCSYPISELSVSLNESPSEVAAASLVLYRLGLIVHSPTPPIVELEESENSNITALIVSADAELKNACISCFPNQGMKLLVSDSALGATDMASRENVDLLVTDGNMTDQSGLAIVSRIKSLHPKLIWIYCQSTEVINNVAEVIRLTPYSAIDAPLFLGPIADVGNKAAVEIHRIRTNDTGDTADYFETSNKRMMQKKTQLLAQENDLQRRENELLRCEELFFEKCNIFEEEQARIDVNSDELQPH